MRFTFLTASVLLLFIVAACTTTTSSDDDDDAAAATSPTEEPATPTVEPEPTETPESEPTETPEPEATETPLPDDDDDADEPAEHTVEIINPHTYSPDEITIRTGDTIVWVNNSDMAHTVTADPERARNEDSVQLPDGAEPFHSESIQPGEEWSYTFTVPGDYTYFCIPHEVLGQIGHVTVEGDPIETDDTDADDDDADNDDDADDDSDDDEYY